MVTTASLLAGQLAQYQKQPKEESAVKTWILPAGSLLIALLAYLSSNQQIPNWATKAIIIYLAVTTAVVIFPILKVTANWVWKIVSRRRLASRYYPSVSGVLVQILESMDSMRNDTMAHLFSNTGTYIEQCDLNYDNFYTIKEWFNSLSERVAERRIDDFESSSREIGRALYQYHKLAVKTRDIFKQKVDINREKMNPLIIEWNTRREKHVAIIEKWTDIAKQINGESSRSICQDYFEPLKML